MTTAEKKLQKKIIDLLKSDPTVYYERRQAGGFSYKAGLPDLWFLKNGKHVEVEVKAPDGFPTGLQLSKEKVLRAAGSLYWRGKNFEDFMKLFVQL